MPVTVVLGAQWGDEGKGKLVDILAASADFCCRCQGGNNAGHTIVVGDKKFDFHLLPSGLINPRCLNVIGNGVVVHIPSLFQELENTVNKGIADAPTRLRLSDRAHLVFDFHQIVDGMKEVELGGGNIGTTKRGIGPAYSAKASRSGLRVHHLMSALRDFESGLVPSFSETSFARNLATVVENRKKRYGQFEYDTVAEIKRYHDFAVRLRPFVVDTVPLVNAAIHAGDKMILVEGANALMLDLDYGTYPYVTSSNCSIGGVCTGLGIPPQRISRTIGVVKAYTTRVGGGPFPTEQLNSQGELLQSIGHEYGVTTGRKRRCGWLDMVVVAYSTMINGYTDLCLTKLDVLDSFATIPIGVQYKINGVPMARGGFPADLSQLERVEVEYEEMSGWQVSIAKCRKWSDLPVNARAYVSRIETIAGVPVSWIGVGPGRDEMINVPPPADR